MACLIGKKVYKNEKPEEKKKWSVKILFKVDVVGRWEKNNIVQRQSYARDEECGSTESALHINFTFLFSIHFSPLPLPAVCGCARREKHILHVN